MSEVNKDNLIDIEAVIAGKFKGKKVPKFLVNFFKKFMHEDFLNSIIIDSGKDGIPFCQDVIDHLGAEVEIVGLENVPDDGSIYTFASNHPLGAVDGLAICGAVGTKFGGNVRAVVNDFLLYIKPLRSIFIGVNKVGGQSRNLPRIIDEAFASKNHMIMFPAGTCSRKVDGKIQDLEWMKVFVKKSVEYGRPIVPVHFIGTNSKRFYRIANLNKKLGIKFNIAMLLLPDEMVRTKGKKFKMIFGKPIAPEFFDKSKTPQEWAQWLRAKVYELN